MSRHDLDLDPQIAEELSALEAALNDAPDADADLVTLVREVRESAPPMPLALQTRLDRDVAAGFPRERRRVRLPRPRLLPALATAAAMVLVAIVGVAALRTRGSDDSIRTYGRNDSVPAKALSPESSAGSASTSAEAPARKSGSADEAGSSAAAPQSSAVPAAPATPTDPARKVERSTQLSLRVAAGKLETAADGVVRATQGVGGYVSNSGVSARGRGGSAQFTLRVPTARLDEAVARLSRLGHVVALDQSSQDITSSVTSSADRLKDARDERRALLRALGKATSATQISSLRARIAANRSEIAQRTGELNALRRRADLATITLSVTARGKAEAVADVSDDHWGPGDAAKDALRVLEVVAGVALIALAVLLPLGLIGGLGMLGGRSARRRRREGALDGA